MKDNSSDSDELDDNDRIEIEKQKTKQTKANDDSSKMFILIKICFINKG
jgi:hypothetical protein